MEGSINLTSTKSVLLVDDEDGIRKLISSFFRKNGFQVLEAGNGVEALRICQGREGSVDLLISDVIMPEMGGWELAETVRLLHPNVKVLFMSGYLESLPQHGQGLANMVLQNSAFVPKPFAPATLLRKALELLAC
jgi:CheY-like chemotaxis protein